MNAAFAAALLDAGGACPAGLRAWNGSDPARRFAVHRNNVVASLLDALADSFPVTQALVGEPFFRAMGARFVRRHPPASPVLAAYGTALPDFIAAFAPARALPYLPDVARLELARVQCCHAADAAPLSAAAVEAALQAGERVGALRFGLHPALRLLVSPHPVVSIWAAHQGQGALEEVDLARAENALVLRPHDDVLVLACDPGCAAFVQALRQDRCFADAAAAVAACGCDLAATLRLLLAQGALSSVALP